MEISKKPNISNEDGVDFMPDIEIQSDDREAILETIKFLVKKERRKKLFAKFDAISFAQKLKNEKDLDSAVIIDNKLTEQFFINLENTVSSVLFDLEIYKRRPTNGQSLEILGRVQFKSAELGHLLGEIDNIAGKGLKQQNFNTDDISKTLLNLSEVIKDEVLLKVQKNKTLTSTVHPLRIMSVNVIKALHEATLIGYYETDKKKVGFIEVIIRHLLELETVEKRLIEITGDEEFTLNVYLRDHIMIELRNFKKSHKILNLQ